MEYWNRHLEKIVVERLKQFPVVAVTGPRQSGKTTMIRHLLPDWDYVNLENLDHRLSATRDPRAFLRRWGDRTIIDEFQRAPELVSYLQSTVDESNLPGMFVLTGSQSYSLQEQLSQSLAGRVAVLELLPFSQDEISDSGKGNEEVWTRILAGSFPRIVPGGISPQVWYPSFVTTYVERDVRQMLAVKDLLSFQILLKLVASRVGQLVNYSGLSRDAGVATTTVKHWLSVLEAGHLLYRLSPWFGNTRKRLVKTPKFYAIDTGLLCSLLNISSESQLQDHPAKGPFFENWVFCEALKALRNLGLTGSFSFFRNKEGLEVDLVIEAAGRTIVMEVKSSSTISTRMAKGIESCTRFGLSSTDRFVVYTGTEEFEINDTTFLPWNQVGPTLRTLLS